MRDFLKKYGIGLSQEKLWKLVFIYGLAIFIMFYMLMLFVNIVFAVFVSGFVLGYFIGFMVMFRYGRKIKVFIQGK